MVGNSKKILIVKKKTGGPILKKYDVKKGIQSLNSKPETLTVERVPKNRERAPKSMFRQEKSMINLKEKDYRMKGKIYSRKDLLNNKSSNYAGLRGQDKQQYFQSNQSDMMADKSETREQMMYRFLRNKMVKKEENKKKDSTDMDSAEVDYEDDYEDEEPVDFESYKNKFSKQREKAYEPPLRRESQPLQHSKKKNSMLPSKRLDQKINTESSSKGRERDFRDSDVDLMNMQISEIKEKPYSNKFKARHRNQPSNLLDEVPREKDMLNVRPSEKKSTSMKPNRQERGQDMDEERKRYKKDMIKDMLDLEDKFTQEYSRHIDLMVGLVKKDISMQTRIRNENGPLKFKDCLKDVKQIVKRKQESLQSLSLSLQHFEEKYQQLKIRKELKSKLMMNMKGPFVGNEEGGRLREPPSKNDPINLSKGNMSGGNQMKGLNIGGHSYGRDSPSNQKFKDFGLRPNMMRGNNNLDYGGYSGKSSNSSKRLNMGALGNQMYQMGSMNRSNRELRPLNQEGKSRKKYSMLPKRNFEDENKNTEEKEEESRDSKDSEKSKDKASDLDMDNEISLI